MQAVVEVKGKQYIVTVGSRIRVGLIDAEKGSTVDMPILLSMDGAKISTKSKTTAQAEVMSHGLAKKIRVFKHHAKKRYRRTQGHRQDFTELEIKAIGATK